MVINQRSVKRSPAVVTYPMFARSEIRGIERHVELGLPPSPPINVASGAVKREQLVNLAHVRTALREVSSHKTNTLEFTLLACLWQLQP